MLFKYLLNSMFFNILLSYSSDVRHSFDEQFNSNKMNTASSNGNDGMEEARHETKLGAIQKNIHQTINSSNSRNLNENVSKISIQKICEHLLEYNR